MLNIFGTTQDKVSYAKNKFCDIRNSDFLMGKCMLKTFTPKGPPLSVADKAYLIGTRTLIKKSKFFPMYFPIRNLTDANLFFA